jgi:hypothetical protein
MLKHSWPHEELLVGEETRLARLAIDMGSIAKLQQKKASILSMAGEDSREFGDHTKNMCLERCEERPRRAGIRRGAFGVEMERPRLLMLTIIEADPGDTQSLVRLMLH